MNGIDGEPVLIQKSLWSESWIKWLLEAIKKAQMYKLLIWMSLMNQSLSESVLDLLTEPQVINNTNKRNQATKRINNIIITGQKWKTES